MFLQDFHLVTGMNTYSRSADISPAKKIYMSTIAPAQPLQRGAPTDAAAEVTMYQTKCRLRRLFGAGVMKRSAC